MIGTLLFSCKKLTQYNFWKMHQFRNIFNCIYITLEKILKICEINHIKSSLFCNIFLACPSHLDDVHRRQNNEEYQCSICNVDQRVNIISEAITIIPMIPITEVHISISHIICIYDTHSFRCCLPELCIWIRRIAMINYILSVYLFISSRKWEIRKGKIHIHMA